MEKDKNIKDIENTNVFEQIDYLTFITKKAEKIVTAIYLVTNLFPTNDPLKNTLREKSVCLLSDVNHIRQNFDSTNVKFIFNLDSSISNILSLLNVAKDTRLISVMNFSILEMEIKNLASSEFDNNKIITPEIVFGNNFFENKNEKNITIKNFYLDKPELSTDEKIKNLYQNKLEILKDNKSGMSFRKGMLGISAHINQVKKIALNKEISRKVGQKQQEAKEKRRMIIKNLMKDNKFIMIKDVMKLMKDCSEKTIQRELNSMVVENLIKREGTRRWSKYYPI